MFVNGNYSRHPCELRNINTATSKKVSTAITQQFIGILKWFKVAVMGLYLHLRGAVQTLSWWWQCGVQLQMTAWLHWEPVCPAGW